MTEVSDFSERYRATLFVCALHADAAKVTVLRGWGQLAAELAPHFAFIGTHGETNVERAARTLSKLAWDRDEKGEIAFLAHEFASGGEIYVTALRTDCVPIEAADWIWRADDLDTPFASLYDLAPTLMPGDVVEIAGGLDTRPAWVVRELSNGAPKIAVYVHRSEASARARMQRREAV